MAFINSSCLNFTIWDSNWLPSSGLCMKFLCFLRRVKFSIILNFGIWSAASIPGSACTMTGQFWKVYVKLSYRCKALTTCILALSPADTAYSSLAAPASALALLAWYSIYFYLLTYMPLLTFYSLTSPVSPLVAFTFSCWSMLYLILLKLRHSCIVLPHSFCSLNCSCFLSCIWVSNSCLWEINRVRSEVS